MDAMDSPFLPLNNLSNLVLLILSQDFGEACKGMGLFELVELLHW